MMATALDTNEGEQQLSADTLTTSRRNPPQWAIKGRTFRGDISHRYLFGNCPLQTCRLLHVPAFAKSFLTRALCPQLWIRLIHMFVIMEHLRCYLFDAQQGRKFLQGLCHRCDPDL